jgi:predicted metal-binding protein
VKENGWSYVFGDLAIENGPDLIEGARLFQTSEDGLIPWRGRPDCLKRGLVSRIPPLSLLKDQT